MRARRRGWAAALLSAVIPLAVGCGGGPAAERAPTPAGDGTIPAGATDAPSPAAGGVVPGDSLLDGAFWRDQGLDDVLPYWTRHARDHEHGAFFAELDRTWQPQGDLHKYPGMIARHLFSYATAYLLTGDDAHLDTAAEVWDYLVAHGWDHEHGGWYDELDRTGHVVEASKDLFNQAYAVTGLAMYWVVTHDPEVKRYLDRSMEILERHAWDAERDGYVRSLNRDLSVKEARKDFSPQIAHMSGYLAYLYPAIRDPALLQRMERIMAVVLERTPDAETGWVRGRFDPDWTYDGPTPARTNVGHNLETGWLLMRLHLLTGDASYRTRGLAFADAMLEHAYLPETGAWAHQLVLDTREVHGDNTPWWVQAYGNMVQLYQYRITGDPRHLDVFRNGARFWNHAFMDPEYGATYLSAFLDGRLHRGLKGVRTKTSYHSMEYALLNYLYLALWVEDEPVELFYRIENPGAGDRLYPSVLEDPRVRIARVTVDGREWTDFDARHGFISLPAADRPVRVRAVLEYR